MNLHFIANGDAVTDQKGKFSVRSSCKVIFLAREDGSDPAKVSAIATIAGKFLAVFLQHNATDFKRLSLPIICSILTLPL